MSLPTIRSLIYRRRMVLQVRRGAAAETQNVRGVSRARRRLRALRRAILAHPELMILRSPGGVGLVACAGVYALFGWAVS